MSKNGIITKPFLDENQQQCVSMFRELLKLAENGEVDSAAVVVCRQKGFANNIAGQRAAELYLGLADLQDQILTKVINNTGSKPASNILRMT